MAMRKVIVAAAALVGGAEAFSLAPGAGAPAARSVVSPRMSSIDQLTKPSGLHVDYGNFRYGAGAATARPLGGLGETAYTGAETRDQSEYAPKHQMVYEENADANYAARPDAAPAAEFRHGRGDYTLRPTGGI